MSIVVTLLISLLRFPYIISHPYTCIPNTEIQINGRVCVCDSTGVWNEANCYLAERRVLCTPGQVITQGCSQCICQEDGKLTCVEQSCSNPTDTNRYTFNTVHWCTPFRVYYVSCNICICPASGLTIEANCAFDTSCTLIGQPTRNELASNKNICMPNVMYLFNCLHCLCGEDGFFNLDKCVETCATTKNTKPSRKCVPKTYYRRDCNVCKCPDDGLPDDKHCTSVVCNQTTNLQHLRTLRSTPIKCTPNTFTNARCLYCDCDSNGKVDENLCLGLECLDPDEFKFDIAKETCIYGEMVPLCMECFCLHVGHTAEEYCTKGCSYQNKVSVLESVMKDSVNNEIIIDRDNIKVINSNDKCKPNFIYKDEGKFCICPANGVTNFNFCTVMEENDLNRVPKVPENIDIDFNMTCEPNTFVDFDCNTCFCSKKGRIDPKWCTYDDCKEKKITQLKHETAKPDAVHEISDKCIPGTISKVDCNFCICPDNTEIKNRVCTKNDCSTYATLPSNDKFVCEPLAYYEVDCNVCFCPRDGLKNVAKCTKNHCEKSFLRSDVCVPGQLFTDECNVCVCPLNGNKAEKACTNHTCSDDAPWKKIYQISENILGNQITEDASRKLDLCFPGEEFVVGCKLCVCPEMGLRDYATCTPMLCETQGIEENTKEIQEEFIRSEVMVQNLAHTKINITQRLAKDGRMSRSIPSKGSLRRLEESCTDYDPPEKPDRKRCSPGSMYIIKCQQCICPYAGFINNFCRPLPKDFHCEQAFEGSNYLPMGRKSASSGNVTMQVINQTYVNTSRVLNHHHTKYPCDTPGRVTDSCFLCECRDDHVLIEEHCFRSEDQKCDNATPTFLWK